MKAYLVLRDHTEEFLTLLHLMLPAGLKELNKAEHINYFTVVRAPVNHTSYNISYSFRCDFIFAAYDSLQR